MRGVGQQFIVAQTPILQNVAAFIQMIWDQGVELFLTLDDATALDVPHWYPKGRMGMQLRYNHIT